MGLSTPRVVVLGGGFSGFHAARNLARRLRGTAEIVLINSTDYFLYLPLLPQVTSGVLDPRRITVPLSSSLPGVRVRLGEVRTVDLDGRTVRYADPEGGEHEVTWDRLVVAIGSVNKLLPIPGVAEHAHGYRGLPEALYLRDHIVGQLEMAVDTEDPVERAARCTFVVVGAGYTGTEVAAQGVLLTDAVARDHPELAGQPVRWLLLDVKPRVLPELDGRLSVTADRVLRRRGVEVRTGTSVTEATADGVRLSTGESLPTRSLIWCVGVRPDPLVQDLGLPVDDGRIVVDEQLVVQGHEHVWACGDAAAVPDPANPGSATPMTAQHAQRHGVTVARNVAASLGHGTSVRVHAPRHGLRRRPRRPRRGGEPAARAAARSAGPGRHDRLPPARDAREPSAHRRRVDAGTRAVPPECPARAGPRGGGAAGHGVPGAAGDRPPPLTRAHERPRTVCRGAVRSRRISRRRADPGSTPSAS